MLKCDIADGAKHYYYPVTNSRGDIMEIHNGPGQITAKYNYDAWGKLLSVTGANGNVLPKTHFAYKISVRYRGYEYDAETGLYYLQSRYYDPETGRFINADDAEYIGSSGNAISFNAFAYCENIPVMKSDKSGHSSIFEGLGKVFSLFRSTSSFVGFVKKSLKMELDESKEHSAAKYKYVLRINFFDVKVKNTWIYIWKSKVCKKTVDDVASLSLEMFKKKFKRTFLFNESCVSKEIYLHLWGYMYSIGEAKTCPPQFVGYYILKDKKTRTLKQVVMDATKVADIYEADVFYNVNEAALYGFNYYGGIANCYKNTKKDPYYNLDTRKRKRNYIRKDWLSEKL